MDQQLSVLYKYIDCLDIAKLIDSFTPVCLREHTRLLKWVHAELLTKFKFYDNYSGHLHVTVVHHPCPYLERLSLRTAHVVCSRDKHSNKYFKTSIYNFRVRGYIKTANLPSNYL